MVNFVGNIPNIVEENILLPSVGNFQIFHSFEGFD